MCPKLIEPLSWNGPTVHVCCLCQRAHPLKHSLAESKRQRIKIFLSRKIRQKGHSLAEVSLYTSHRFTLYPNEFSSFSRLYFTIPPPATKFRKAMLIRSQRRMYRNSPNYIHWNNTKSVSILLLPNFKHIPHTWDSLDPSPSLQSASFYRVLLS